MRLRKGQKSYAVEQCKAIFVTTNNRLSYNIKHFYGQNDSNSIISPVISDYVLTTIQWIKNPDIYPSLPKKRIIADCVASLQPTERAIKAYLKKIKTLNDNGQISDENYYLLRTSEAKDIMMDKSLGDEEVITNIDYNELAGLTKQRIGEEKDQIIKQQEMIINENKKALEQKENEKKSLLDIQARKEQKQRSISRMLSFVFHAFMVIVATGLFLFGQYYVINHLETQNFSITQNWIGTAFLYIIPLLGFWGIGFWFLVKKSHSKVQRLIYGLLYN
ncbi:hypothetical protein [Sutcliffiella cohnii]|uniref:hypothetical protein n=1 Tax=Sutcliffiella cohnii TaxID=33932 RepID=UPI00082F151F|nr:hypothetical protein [Sutcliffiella cohnii]